MDVDDDSYRAEEAGGSDCDDTDADIHPGAAEVCNGRDDDCDEEVDEGLLFSVWADADDDGYGDPDTETLVCEQPAGTVTEATDCDDTDPAVHPGAQERCSGADDDCDGYADQMIAGSTHETVQEALDAACAEGDQVWVLPGTWVENIDFPPWNLELVSTDGAEATILDGSSCTGRDCPVVEITGIHDASTLIEGFTITGGHRNYAGGGIHAVEGTGLTLRDCIIEGNTAGSGGGLGIYYSSEPSLVEGCTFRDNEAWSEGGGIYARRVQISIIDSHFEGNEGASLGGGASITGDRSTPLPIEGNSFENNRADYGGGFVTYCCYCDLSTVTNNSFVDNRAAYGGGLYAEPSSCGELDSTNTFSGNTVDDAVY